MPIENFKNFKAPELKYLILVQLKLPVWWSEAYLLGNAFWVSFWLINVGWASCESEAFSRSDTVVHRNESDWGSVMELQLVVT